MTTPVIIVHGGAGEWPVSKQEAGLLGVERAASRGFAALRAGGSAVRAVEAAVVSLENTPIFNAGTGSALNLAGRVEADAAIMDGSSLRCGAVALLRGVKNPVTLARLVMDRTDHILMAGPAAERLARLLGVAKANLKVPERTKAWRRGRRDFAAGRLSHLKRNYKMLRQRGLEKLDTVGALALDHRGNLAAACSTGGISLKLPGRIGDSAIIGAGLYADNRVGSATATGVGELAIMSVVSKTVCDLMKEASPASATAQTVRSVGKRIGKGLGVIALDRHGRHGVAHNTPHLCWAIAKGSGSLCSRIRGTLV